MKKTITKNKTNIWSRSITMLFMLFTFFNLNAAMACDLTCGGQYNVGFDSSAEDCEAVITVEDVINNSETACDGGDLVVHILDETGDVVLSEEGIVLYEYVGRKLQYKVVDEVSGNSCWGYLLIEDKKKPTFLDCDDIDGQTFFCYEEVNLEPTVAPDCDFENITVRVTNEVRRQNRCDGTYDDDDILEEVTRTYVAEDAHGNVSIPCEVTYFVRRLEDLEDIEIPSNLSKLDGTNLNCFIPYPLDEYGNPSPIDKDGLTGTGVPTIVIDDVTIDLFPNDDQFCNLLVDYQDEVIVQGCKTKIVRTWKVYEWACTETSDQRILDDGVQLIEIVDDRGPSIEPISDITVSTSAHDCAGNIFIPKPTVADTCDRDVTVDLRVEGGTNAFYPDFEGDFIPLDTGENVLTFIARDVCGNENEEEFNVTVLDLTSPTAVCISYTTVSLNSDGIAKVPAAVFDNGSKDECRIAAMKVRRMDKGMPCMNEDTDTDFDDYVAFCCADVGNDDLMIVFRVYDAAGNYNECMVNVKVEDKLPPAIVCPPDITVECGFNFVDYNIFGEIQQAFTDVEPITLGDALIDWEGGIGQLTDGYAVDNCNVTVTTEMFGDLNQCNEGTIERVFTAKDPGGRTTQCSQFITFKRSNPLSYDDINWPVADTLILGCISPDDDTFTPENLGEPGFESDECILVGVNYDDELFSLTGDDDQACFKLIRTWTVIDWCEFDKRERGQSIDDYKFSEVQVIKSNDTIAPTITGDYDPKTTCTFDPTCTDGFIELIATANDNCTAELRGNYRIDRDNDGSFDINPTSSQTGGIINASGDYPIGTHRIVFTFTDLCGNISSQEQIFTIFNCKAPTPYAYDGLAIDLMPVDTDDDNVNDNGMAELWASDFDAGSFHPCGYPVILSFSADTTMKSRTFTCLDQGEIEVELWASVLAPTGELIQSFAIASLDVQDNMDACDEAGTTEMANVSGRVATADDVNIDKVVVALEGSEMNDFITGEDGAFAFPSMPVGGNYTINPSKNDDITNGVSTLDLVKIQRHILGIKSFDKPEQIIAADINKDQSLKASDIIELRKVILGLKAEFNNNQSWRFIDKDFTFFAIEDALEENLPEVYDIRSLDNDMSVNFVGIKVGDVDGDVTLGNARSVKTRNSNSIDIATNFGENHSISLTLVENLELIGLEMSLQLPEGYQLLNVSSEAFNVDASHYTYDKQTNILSLSLDAPHGILFNEGDEIFNLIGSSHSFTNVSLTNVNLKNEAYNQYEEVLDLNLINSSTEEGAFSLGQNNPNPFTDYTEIGFNLPEEGQVTLTVFDMTGKQLLVRRGNFSAGNQTIRLNKSDLSASGILYYQLESGKYLDSKKMVVLN